MRRLMSIVVILSLGFLLAADYPQFRGPAGNGVIQEASVPTRWSAEKNLVWKTPLPGSGWAQPVVVGKTVFVTAAVGKGLARPKDMEAGVRDPGSMPIFGAIRKGPDVEIEWQILALDADHGSIRWTRTIVKGKPKYPIHPSNTYATETPCADAERVYAFFGATGTLAALDHSGKEVWKVELGAYPFSNGFGSGSSPLLHDGKIVITSFNEQKGFVVAFDARTGKELWRQTREKPGSAWASPFLWRNSLREEIIACGDKLVTSHDPASGKELWRLGGIDTAFAPSPAADGDLLLLAASSPFSASPIFGVQAGASGDITLKKGEKSGPHVAWYRNNSGVGMASPAASGGYLYIPGQSTLICVDVKTGEQKYKERLPRSRGVTACPVIVGDKVLILDEAGKATWIKTGPQFVVLDNSQIEDTFWASPALVGERIYLRGVEGLYCIQKK